MVVRWHSGVLNRNIAPGISEFTHCDAPDLTVSHPEAPHWLANYFLNSVFRGQLKGTHRQYAMNLLFRAQACFNRYHSARELTLQYLNSGDVHNPAIRTYFLALVDWESCFLNAQIFIDILNKMSAPGSQPMFVDGDGSPEQRAYAIANSIKHWGSDLAQGRHSDDHTVPLWLSNAGFQSRSHRVTFAELGELVEGVALLASDLQDPASLAKRAKEGQPNEDDGAGPA
jgi:hypothetical protein